MSSAAAKIDPAYDFLGRLAEQEKAAATVEAKTHEAYKGARRDRLNNNWDPAAASGDTGILESVDLLTRRVRDLCRNDAILRNALQKLITLVIGTGINVYSDAKRPGGDPFDDFADEADEEFLQWAETEADVSGRLSWFEMQQLAYREMLEAGSPMLLRCQSNASDRSVPLCYQLLESEQLDTTKDRPAGGKQNKIVGGIEVDRLNRPVNYWLFDAHPHDTLTPYTTQSQPVPAARVTHLFYPFRISQTVGVTWFNPVMQSARDCDLMVGNELTAGSIASMFTAVHKTEYGNASGLDDGTDDEDQWGNPKLRLGKGTVVTGSPRDEFEVIESKRPNKDMAPFVDLLMTLIAMGSGISVLRLMGRYDRTSYSAARASHLDDQAFVTPLQNHVGRQLVLPVRRAHNDQAAAMGLYRCVTPAEYRRHKRRLSRFDVYGPGREQIDPEKETDGATARCRAGLSNIIIENARAGRHWKRVLRGKRRAEVFAASIGTTIDLSKQQGGNSNDQRSLPAPEGEEEIEHEEER